MQVDKIPPHNATAERSVLGAMILDQEAAYLAGELLRPEDFYESVHKTVFQTILKTISEGKDADPVVISDRIQSIPNIDPNLTMDLTGEVPSAANIEGYADIVRKDAIRRHVIKSGIRMIQNAHDPDVNIEELSETIEASVMSIAGRDSNGGFHKLNESIKKVLSDFDKGLGNEGLETGIMDYDRLTGGLKPGSLNLVAAAPSMGKSSFALNVALHIAKDHNVAFATMEDTEEGISRRALARISNEAWPP